MGLGRRHLLNVFAVLKSFYDELDLFHVVQNHPSSTATSAPGCWPRRWSSWTSTESQSLTTRLDSTSSRSGRRGTRAQGCGSRNAATDRPEPLTMDALLAGACGPISEYVPGTYPALMVASRLMTLLPVYWGASTPMGSNMDTPSELRFNHAQRPRSPPLLREES